ncbi:MAG: hypothetical protein HY908_14600, partial [Myxococcales bacterium]|nr:hypothetical protein [Myxococcales bacterium]
RVAACAGADALPPELDARTVERHCAALGPKLTSFRAHLGKVRDFVAGVEPPSLPTAVVYPFAGGDVATALAVYPRALELTTVSLELAGDPRRLGGLGEAALDRSLAALRRQLDELLATSSFSFSDTLKFTQHGDIPGEIAFFLVGLALHDREPVHMRFFRLEPDGRVRYLTDEDIGAADGTVAARRKESWFPPDFSEAFANVEIAHRARAGGAAAPLAVHRHVAANLGDAALARNGALLLHLADKGPVAVLVKAASYLLWGPGFDLVRDYLTGHMAFGISDSSGLLPEVATRAGFVLETYGSFLGTRIPASGAGTRAMVALFRAGPARPLPFRFGYVDTSSRPSLIVARKP